ncbi:hypothetical protein, partial [Leptospira weilii]|uniref:hypothetical protein n=1 Tax=Leptospira weilii TaxID=28184 RepID=UPI000AB9CCFB
VHETQGNIFFFLSFSPFTSILGKKGVHFFVTRPELLTIGKYYRTYNSIYGGCNIDKSLLKNSIIQSSKAGFYSMIDELFDYPNCYKIVKIISLLNRLLKISGFNFKFLSVSKRL